MNLKGVWLLLFNIQGSVQEVAEAISVVLNVDVTIVDKNLYRVAATGMYRDLIGKPLPNNSSFQLVIETGQTQFVDRPNISEKCASCSLKGNCAELASIGYPIKSGEELLGVIGLIAFDSKQKKRIKENYDSLVVFLRKMGDLLAGNLKYINTITSLTIQGEELKKIIDGLGNGIICTDTEGNIKFANSKAEDYLNIEANAIINKPIAKILPDLNFNIALDNPVETKVTVKGKKQSFIIKINPVKIEKEVVSNIIEVHETTDMVRNAYKLIEGVTNISFDHIVGNSPSIRKVKNLAKEVAKSKSTVLLRGESGTGKELFARAIHNASDRKNFPFVAINCSSIPDNLLESELFGYVGGAFTGASKQGQMGKLELANGGTLFLDEIGDLPLHLQPKILRVLQEGSFMRLGGKELISVDFRLIAATNQNLEEMVEKGEFREDLYYRLNVIPIYIPPLRERVEDINELSQFLLEKCCNRLRKELKVFSQEVKDAFNNYDWPGNVRELENVIEYLINVVPGKEITFEYLPDSIKGNLNNHSFKKNHNNRLKDILDNYEKELLKSYIEQYGDSTEDKKRIASILGINLSTLYRKLNKYNLQ